ncbi:MAG TPA: type IV pilus twitching motility protein PilT [Candidatus Saccharimonadales bacterium]|nr:type IV pilus twitching motility protein PilT [Candidatus Saccharimonadales bacterium]
MDVKSLFKLAAKKNASDIHMNVGQGPILRIDGELFNINDIFPEGHFPVLDNIEMENLMEVVLTKEQKRRFLDKRDLDLAYQVEAYRYRVNFSFEKNNVCLVARIINEQEPSLAELGLPPIVEKMLNLHQGLLLVTGPTGCGKSTTLAAMINHINTNTSVNIITLEDPIEYIFKPKRSIISQRQLGSDMISFASGLKHALRQDPNVIMIGEMRDLETISTAVTLAETGHLVLATLHTYSAAQTVDRIIDIFPPYQQNQIKSQLSFVLSAIISQRLLIKNGGGRVAAREILLNNSAIANLIREGKVAQIKSVIETGGAAGMITMDKHVKQLYKDGIISREIALGQLGDPGLLGD